MEFFGIFCLRELQGRGGELLDEAAWLREQWGHVSATADIHALALIAAGRTAEARQAVAGAGPVRPDYFYDLAMTLRGRRAIALDDTDLAEEVYRALLPYEDHVAGGACASATLGPVARTLGDLAISLGRPAPTAAAHYRRAAQVAERLDARLWTEEAREALRRLGTPAA